MFSKDTQRQLLGRHFQREQGNDMAVHPGLVAAIVDVVEGRARRVEGDVGRQGGLAHAGTAGEDEEVGPLQATQEPVEPLQAGGHAGEHAFAPEGRLGHLQRRDEGAAKLLEAAFEGAGGGEFEQAVLRLLDLLHSAAVDVGGVGVVDHVLAELDQAAPQV